MTGLIKRRALARRAQASHLTIVFELQLANEVLDRIRAIDGRFNERAYLFVLSALEYCQRHREERKKKFPSGRNAGCIFKNPEGISAGKLIDELGLKGSAVGKARISKKHANFIIAEQDATASDVLTLMNTIRDEVKKHKGIVLEPELNVVGEP